MNLTVTDSAGNIVYEAPGSTEFGAQTVTFRPTELGIDIPEDGTLTLFVNAKDQRGETLDKSITSYALVDGVDTTEAFPFLTAGSGRFNPDLVLRIAYDPLAIFNTAPTATATTTGDTT